jgi:hypothetical protein
LACEVLGVSASGYFEHGRRKKFPKPSKPGAHKLAFPQIRRRVSGTPPYAAMVKHLLKTVAMLQKENAWLKKKFGC